MADFTITGAISSLSFSPSSLQKPPSSSIIANNNATTTNPSPPPPTVGASVTLYVYYSSNGSSGWASDTTLFSPAVSQVTIAPGANQTVGTISSTASTTGAYQLSPSTSPPANSLPRDSDTGGNVKVNVGS